MKTQEEKFWSLVQKTDTCWIWNGYKLKSGYGQHLFNGKVEYCHRVSQMLAGKELFKNTSHTCGQRSCVNPEHLVPTAINHGEDYKIASQKIIYKKKREKLLAYQKVRRLKAPWEERTREAVKKALKAGILKKEPCEECGKVKSLAHHDDYNFPLQVRWLCGSHHRLWHRDNKPIYQKTYTDMEPNYTYPICPECGCNTVVLFSPPREGIVGTKEGYETMGTSAYVDWDKAHLYCANAETNCHLNTLLSELTTPITEPRFNMKKRTNVEKELLAILQRYCGERGDNEGAIETLERIVSEREVMLRNAIKEKLLKLV